MMFWVFEMFLSLLKKGGVLNSLNKLQFWQIAQPLLLEKPTRYFDFPERHPRDILFHTHMNIWVSQKIPQYIAWPPGVWVCIHVYTYTRVFQNKFHNPWRVCFYMYKSVSQKKITFLWDLHVNTSITQDIMCVCTFSFYVYTNFAQGIAW